ncbi:GntR family transcriptional regulator [Breznakiella homolactica]|uniref:GntR family transcriptional regulator n=1 Tax=Breznakiella homolactica TaxID=2798577 RepID=A0A7T7XJS6_9SPIR|nr:GntR family transcriptional regulator [Breznakiella homolactica]QQO07710.1 GntR family transcriptional regulator [Breznakiella homolactica]
MKKEPIYIKIEQDIIRSIALNELRADDQIMTEEQLCKKYQVSRMTINKAIVSLVSKGYIYRIPGKGSFVKYNQVSKRIGGGTSFTQDMIARGIKPGSKLIDYYVKRGKELPFIRDRLKLGDDDLIHYFVRLRTGDGTPMAISYTYVSGDCIPAMDLNALETSFYAYVESLGLKIKKTEGEVTSKLPTEEQQKILRIKNEALLVNTHATYLDDGRIMEYIQTYYIGSRYGFSYVFHRDVKVP